MSTNLPRYSSMQQYEPLRAPEGWGESGRQFVVRLTAILDDIYRRYGRLSTADLGAALNAVLAGLRNDLTGQQTVAAEHETRLNGVDTTLAQRATDYAEDMLEIDAALEARVQKTSVIGDINASTEAGKIGPDKVNFIGATIGGLHVEAARVYTNGGVEITDDAVKVGSLSLTQNSDGSITVASRENSLILSVASTVTGVTANVYIDPATGILKRII